MQLEIAVARARQLDSEDALGSFRNEFLFPRAPAGDPCVYLAGNSLGLQPRKARAYIEEVLEDWASLGVEGHLKAKRPWLPYHEQLTEQTARLVGARPGEVVVMNTLTVNLHLMLASFYRPTRERFRVLMEPNPFPSDRYAMSSQVRWHGHPPEEAIRFLAPATAEGALRTEDVVAQIEKEGPRLCLVLLGNVNFLTGQAYDVRAVTHAAHRVGAKVGFDLAHGAGNLLLRLHDDGPDFAVWCSYKYLNGGPGTVAGCFVHERHARATDLPRLEGWWGHDKATRFLMGPTFTPLEGAEAWQLSNPPIFQMAALRASMELFDAAGMAALRQKSERLTGFLEELLEGLPPGFCEVVTPRRPQERGAQLSLRVRTDAKALQARLLEAGIVCDAREPDILRVAPAPLYCSFDDVYRLGRALHDLARG